MTSDLLLGHIGEASFSSALKPDSRLVGRRGEETSTSVEFHRLDDTRCTRRGGNDDNDDDGDETFQREFWKSPCVGKVFVALHSAMIVEA